MTSVSERQAIDDVVADLVDHFDAVEEWAQTYVARFASEHPMMGYDSLADAVHENTSYVVAEYIAQERSADA